MGNLTHHWLWTDKIEGRPGFFMSNSLWLQVPNFQKVALHIFHFLMIINSMIFLLGLGLLHIFQTRSFTWIVLKVKLWIVKMNKVCIIAYDVQIHFSVWRLYLCSSSYITILLRITVRFPFPFFELVFVSVKKKNARFPNFMLQVMMILGFHVFSGA